jgi:hypothetical protein
MIRLPYEISRHAYCLLGRSEWIIERLVSHSFKPTTSDAWRRFTYEVIDHCSLDIDDRYWFDALRRAQSAANARQLLSDHLRR